MIRWGDAVDSEVQLSGGDKVERMLNIIVGLILFVLLLNDRVQLWSTLRPFQRLLEVLGAFD